MTEDRGNRPAGETVPELMPVAGIRLAAVAAGIRKKGGNDLVLMELAEGTRCAAVFTRNAFCAAPVVVARDNLAACASQPRYLLINAGNANAGTGAAGMIAARACVAAVAAAPAYARGGGGGGHGGGGWHGGGGGWKGGGGGWHGGGSHGGGWHGGGGRWYGSVGVVVGPGWGWGWGWPYYGYGWPYYGYGYGYPYYGYAASYPAYAPAYAPSVSYVEKSQSTSYWYYCTDPAGYYPYVQTCSKTWMQVVPQNNPDASGVPPDAAGAPQ